MDSDKAAEPVQTEAQPNNVEKNDDTDGASSPKIAKLDESETPGKKGRNSTGGRKKSKNPADELIAEAKAVCGGELDTSEGRRLRKRSDPPPKVVEEKKKATPKRNTKKKQAEKVEENGEQEDSESKDVTAEVEPVIAKKAENGEKTENKETTVEKEEKKENGDAKIEATTRDATDAKSELPAEAGEKKEETKEETKDSTSEPATSEKEKTEEPKQSE